MSKVAVHVASPAIAAKDAVIAVLSAILESPSLRILPRNEETKADPWQALSKSLGILVSLLKQSDQSGHLGGKQTPAVAWSREHDEDSLVDAVILNVEEAVRQIRLDVEVLTVAISRDSMTALDLCQELKRADSKMVLFSTTMEGAIRHQEALTLKMMGTISMSLSDLYCLAEREGVLRRLDSVSRNIQVRYVDGVGSPWHCAVRILESLTRTKMTTSVGAKFHMDNEALMSVPTKETMTTRRGQSILGSSPSLHDAVKAILKGAAHELDVEVKASSFLLVGPEGSGKTYLLNQIVRMAQTVTAGDVIILRPSLPFDITGASTVGVAEDMLVSTVCCALTRSSGQPCIVLLDDIDIICGPLEPSDHSMMEAHITTRLRGLVLTLLDSVRWFSSFADDGKNRRRLILICSTKVYFENEVSRFDEIFKLGQPNDVERNDIIASCITDGDDLRRNSLDQSTLANLVECTSGFGRAELSQCCRQALLAAPSTGTNIRAADFLARLKARLQSSTPESVKSGLNSDFVDLRVFSGRDLQQLYPILNPKNPILDLPVFGAGARSAWKDIHRLIVIPICHGPALDRMMFHRECHRKAFSGGVLLAGEPGTGKSALAYFCAAFASSINPSVKLIDVSCTSLIHKELGGSERALHRLFQAARSATPCIVLLDGIENIGAVRGNDNTTEGTMDRVLSTLLTELDGVENEQESVVNSSCMAIIGITHNPNWIDPALRRPGRLGQTIILGNPDWTARKDLFLKELDGTVYVLPSSETDFPTLNDLADRFATDTEAYTGADVIALCDEIKLLSSKARLRGNTDHLCVTPQLVLEAVAAQRPGKSR
jgi:SpoVK/Ycf46/Vps4 family AAA+-type ATPase